MKNTSGFVYNHELPVSKLGQLLRALERNGATGKLKLERGKEQVTILFMRGWPSQTWTSWPRARIGQLLVDRGALSKESLESALDIQKKTPHLRLGDVLLNAGCVVSSELAALLTEQATEPLTSVAEWGSCRATFDSMPNVLSPFNSIPIGSRLSEIWDQLYPGIFAARLHGCRAEAPPVRPSEELTRVCIELRTASSTSDWAGILLNYALKYYSRSALFYRSAETWRGYAMAKAQDQQERWLDRRLKNALLPANGRSLFDQVATRGSAQEGVLPANDWNRHLVGTVGGGWPTSFVAIPVGAGSSMKMALYADTNATAPGRPMQQALLRAASVASESLEEVVQRRQDRRSTSDRAC